MSDGNGSEVPQAPEAPTPPEPQTLVEITVAVRDSSTPSNVAEQTFTIELREPIAIPEGFLPPSAPPPGPPPPPPPALRLVLDEGEPTQRELVLDDVALLHITEVDYGYPEPRAVVEDLANRDGVDDKTAHVGARTVTLTGKIGIDWPGDRNFGPTDSTMGGRRQQVIDQLRPFLHPGRRPWLYSRFDDGSVRRIRLRADQFSRPQIADVQDISFSFKSVGAGFQDEHPQEIVVVPELPMAGRRYDLTFPRVYPAGTGTAMRAVNSGEAEVDWVARIFGPCYGPEIVLSSANPAESVICNGVEVPEGHYLEVDVSRHTVRMDGLAENSRWGGVDFANSVWWQLRPGENWVRLRVAEWQSPCQMLFSWRNESIL